MYYCNPDLNTACGKQSCYICGGDCMMTENKDFARTGDIPHEQAYKALDCLIDQLVLEAIRSSMDQSRRIEYNQCHSGRYQYGKEIDHG